MKVANDAASRNALNKLQSALTKVIGEAGTAKKIMGEESVVDVALEDSTVIQKAELVDNMKMKTEEGPEDMGTNPEVVQGQKEGQDSLLEELLNDEDEEMEL